MIEVVIKNLPTIIGAAVVLAVVAAVVVKMFKTRKKTCGGCSSCPMAESCHKK